MSEIPQSSKNDEPEKRKRKREKDKTHNQALWDSLNTGKLVKLLDMPLDILIEIFSMLCPIDLLSLCRSAKDIRAFLLNRSNSIITWKRSLALIEAPECSPHISEPAYACLLLEKTCYFCLRTAPFVFDWIACLRVCTKCRGAGEEYVRWEKLPFNNSLESWTGRFFNKEFASLTRPYHRPLYSVKIIGEWRQELRKLGGGQEIIKAWCLAKKEVVQAMKKHGKISEEWLEEKDKRQKDLEATQAEQRRTLMFDRIKSDPRWAKDVADLGDEFQEELSIFPPFVKAASKELTKSSYPALDKKTDALIQTLKQRRNQRQLAQRLEICLPMLQSLYAKVREQLPVNLEYPSVSEVFLYPAIRAVIDDVPWNVLQSSGAQATMWKSFFSVLQTHHNDIVAHWRARIEKNLIDQITSKITIDAEQINPPSDFLTQPYIVFSCSACKAANLRFPNVAMHSCAILPSYAVKDENSENEFDYINAVEKIEDEEFLNYIILENFWNTTGYIFFDPNCSIAMERAIKLLGLHPSEATVTHINSIDPVYECLFCHRSNEGRAMFGWLAVPYHVHPLSPRAVDGIEPLQLLQNKFNVELARSRIRELELRAQGAPGAQKMICVHCKMVGNSLELAQHVKKVHKLPVESLISKDFVPFIGAVPDSSVFYLWPPRIDI